MCTNDETRSAMQAQNDVIIEFCGYRLLKSEGRLYDPKGKVAKRLIERYYEVFSSDEVKMDAMKKRFVSNYVRNESKIEGIYGNRRHSTPEYEGLNVK